MSPTTRYGYEKRIRDLQARLRRIEEQHDQYRDICGKLYDWLHAFGKTGAETPNAAFGLGLFRPLIWRAKE